LYLTEEQRKRNVERVKARYHGNADVRESTKERAARWGRENRDKRLVIEHRMRDKNPARYLLNSSRSNARKRNLPHTITEKDISIPDICPVFKTSFIFNTPYAPSIDRIDNSKGYVPGNIQIISKKANMLKSNASQDELVMFSKWVLHELG
jgi:hypothetical protein